MKAWIIGLALSAAAPLIWRYLKNELPKTLAGLAMKQIRLALAGAGVSDPDVKELLTAVVHSLVLFAEKKLPDEGLGEQRMALILSLLAKTPLIGAYLQANEKDIREVIENCVKEMDKDLKEIK